MTIGVLVMAHGTPRTRADVADYYTLIRRGRPPTPEQLADLLRRYEAIASNTDELSPLQARTDAQRSAIEAALRRDFPAPDGSDLWVVATGNKHAPPFIEDGIAELAGAGVDSIVGVVLAPHHSTAAVGAYHRRAADAAGAVPLRGCPYTAVGHWYDLEEFVVHQAAALREALAASPARSKVLFTAHSLPESALVDDTYPDQLRSGAGAIAARAGLGPWADWTIAWQSAGRTPEPWRGPDVTRVIDDLADTGRADGVVVVPHGFCADHLEVLYDLDIEAAARAGAKGLRFTRTAVVNDDPEVMSGLAARIARIASTTAGRYGTAAIPR